MFGSILPIFRESVPIIEYHAIKKLVSCKLKFMFMSH